MTNIINSISIFCDYFFKFKLQDLKPQGLIMIFQIFKIKIFEKNLRNKKNEFYIYCIHSIPSYNKYHISIYILHALSSKDYSDF